MGSSVNGGASLRLLAWAAFVLVMAFMSALTLLVLCFFLPFVALKALWVLLVQPLFSPEKRAAQKAGTP